MSSPVPLRSDTHARLKVVESNDFTRYKDQHLIPIVTQDFFTLVAEFPLVFVKNDKTKEFVPVAIMGLRENHNLYCQTPNWKPPVVPASFRNAPFTIAKTDEAGEQLIVLVDESSPLLSKTEGQALYSEDGKRTDYFERRIEALLTVAQQTVTTREMCKLFADKDLFATQQVQLRYKPDSPAYNIDGIYTINEEVLNKLPDEDFLELRKQGLLALIYAHLASLQQLRRVSQLQYESDKAGSSS